MAEERTREMQPGLADNLWRTRFFDLSLDLLCIAGFDGYYKQLNPAWQRMLGFTNEELYATPYLDIIHPDDREPTRAEVQNLAVGEDLHSFSCRMRQKQGGYRWILWSARNFRDEHLIYAIGKDITERKRAEEVQADLIGRLQTVLAEIKTLRGLLPMCAWCKKVRDDQDFWHSVEDYISARTDANFSHGICPECFSRAAKGLERKNRHE